ncbi:MAG: UDP-N-acetylmuramoyl-L-alanine--D-glutamate ligase, partial [Betaproteobacteria bacterium]|nr:UDP-N-acetylmuramoyl-L-alanine--D-glutamate ligase [Betaproteobacteria bacterium]
MMNAQLPLQQREKITALQGKVVLVLGAGKTGTSIVRWLTCVGAVVILADSRARPPGIARLEAEFPDLSFQAGPFINLNYDDFDLVVTSPGVPLDALPLEQLEQKNISVVGDIEIFLCENRDRFESKVLAITGTNGKSTVTRMVETILKESGADAVAVGNIGTPVLEILTQIVTGERKAPDVFVLEISSFQIDTTFTLDFHGAVILNISEDHLDRYENYEAYIKSKSRIYSGAGKKVL